MALTLAEAAAQVGCNRELFRVFPQVMQQDAQTEVQDLTNQLQGDFQEKLNPIIEQLRVDKGLLLIFSIRDSGVVAAEPGLDLSAEIIKRFDAAAKTPPKK